MQQSPRQIAEFASFQAFTNGYLREVDKGRWLKREDWILGNIVPEHITGKEIVEITLPNQKLHYAIEVNYKSETGRHTFGTAFKYSNEQKSWKQENYLSMMLLFIYELHLQKTNKCVLEFDSKYEELTLRLINSLQLMELFITRRKNDSHYMYSPHASFIETEQSLLFGHWLHPTPKSRQGMSDWQHELFSPELCGRFQLYYFRIDRSLIEEDSAELLAPSILIQEFLEDEDLTLHDDIYIPVHPLQAQWLLHQPSVKKAMKEGLITNIGLAGCYVVPTSSIRTVYHQEKKWMLKFSIPVKITNSKRVNKMSELKAGVIMSKLIRTIDFVESYPSFQVIDDPAYLTVRFPKQKESGFELILRKNVFQDDANGISIAALVQEPLPGQSSPLKNLIQDISHSEGTSLKEVSLKWFSTYFDCVIIPLLQLYDQYGIALEAHQQNSILSISKDGYPSIFYYRDNQGYYLSTRYKKQLTSYEPSLKETLELFYDETIINERFTYYMIVNHLFSIIHRFGVDELIEETDLVECVCDKLAVLQKDLSGVGKQLIQALLTNEELAYKANLLTSLHNVDELTANLEQAVYTTIPNPLQNHSSQRREHAYAASSGNS
ncbi:IucA/IucC family protein [Bacillus suaedaesalsae]|uniref:Siderophore biosynthesis protein n=1 Tax=Bacillus suaedaesalsae TaxID=2810349 RepID=A0ABS2DKB0_9BACI|nr:IucA/IucC family protein [Bacillus suaedaesalsae]MBM6618939.1 siderophore biosynthesis protein [Bacillus suaedaesalsae]